MPLAWPLAGGRPPQHSTSGAAQFLLCLQPELLVLSVRPAGCFPELIGTNDQATSLCRRRVPFLEAIRSDDIITTVAVSGAKAIISVACQINAYGLPVAW